MSQTRKARAARFAEVDLYPVTSAAQSVGRDTLQIVRALVAAGCRVLQLREKDLTKRDLFELAGEVRRVAADALLVIDDHLDVALAVGADGVHLGQTDLPLQAARALAPDLLLGASSHSLAEALAAEAAGADYVNIGPIFPTNTKPGAGRFLGPEAIAEIGPRLGVPFTVMGGINAGNLDEVLAAGARHVAVVSAVTAAADPCAAAEKLRRRIQTAGPADDSIR